MKEPDFYLASTEGYGLDEPRRCWRVGRISTSHRDDLLLIKCEPPIGGKRFNIDEDMDLLIVAARHQGTSLFPISEWPVYVRVARPLVEHPELADYVRPEDLKEIAWAELYLTEGDARSAVS
jgi:hypothetical protein